MTTKTTKKKRCPGRPKGARNRRYYHAVAIPAACPCGNTDLKIIPGSASRHRELHGTLPTGQPYHAITWRRKYCPKCRRNLFVREFHVRNTVKPDPDANENYVA